MPNDRGDAPGWPRVCVVGPLPPPAGGMANQCEQLVRLLGADGVQVEVVRNNAPYRPRWVARFPVLRAGARLFPYVLHLWRAAGRAQVMHVLANSGWAWHVFTVPALLVARAKGTPVIINYRGGNADTFFTGAPSHVLRSLKGAALRVTPSAFLLRVFAKHGVDAEVIPNIIDLSRFARRPLRRFGSAPHLVVARNLERIYDIPTAIRAFAEVRRSYPEATLTVAGTGPELAALRALTASLGLGDAIRFPGKIDNVDMPALYARADCALNPSTADNMPISVLEAFASGVPVVSTDAGGVPDIVAHEVSGLLVPVGDARAMGAQVCRVLGDASLAQRLTDAGCEQVQQYSWPAVKTRWLDAYRRSCRPEDAP